ncbi:MAG: phage tail protein [Defluviitaleaceae bacterium]|nr:phage tail protein [Defluviitaleaceae bacterium]
MARGDNFWITRKGRELIAGLAVGENLHIDRIMVGSGNIYDTTAEPDMMTDLIEPVATATRTTPVRTGAEVHFTIQYRNQMHPDIPAFELNEFGGFTDDGTLIFYGTLGDNPHPVGAHDASGGSIQEIPLSMPVAIALAEGVGLTFTFPAGAFVTAQELETRVWRHEQKLVTDPGGVHGFEMQITGDTVTAILNGTAFPLGGLTDVDLQAILNAIATRAPGNTALSTAQWTNALATAIAVTNGRVQGNITQAMIDSALRITAARATAIDGIGTVHDVAADLGTLMARTRSVIDRLIAGVSMAARDGAARITAAIATNLANLATTNTRIDVSVSTRATAASIGDGATAEQGGNEAGVTVMGRLRNLRSAIGQNADAANAGGSANAKLAEILANRLGANNAAANTAVTATQSAKLNAIIARLGTTGTGVRVSASVQRGIANVGGAHITSVAIANVDISRSFVALNSFTLHFAGTIQSRSTFRVNLVNGTTINIATVPTSTAGIGIDREVAWQVVAFN